MSYCGNTVIPIQPDKLCSGKCGRGACSPSDSVWVLATCSGMAALFSQQPGGSLKALEVAGETALPLAGPLQQRLCDAAEHGQFAQLVVVGSPNDIAWTMLSLSPAVAKKVIAEVKYPLISDWFQPEATPNLARVLETTFHA